MRLFIVIVLLLTPFVVSAKKKYTPEDTARINEMIHNVDLLVTIDRDSAIALNRRAYAASVAVDYPQGIADAGWLIGTYEMHRSKHDIAHTYYQKSIEIYRELDLQEKLAEVYTLEGINHGMQNQSALALGWFMQALDIAEKVKNERQVADITYKIGLVYGQVGDYESAVHYVERSLEYAKRQSDTDMLIIVYNNLGLLYAQMNKYDKSLETLTKGLALANNYPSARVLPELYQNIGSTYRELGQYDSSMYYLKTALQLHTETDFISGIASTSSAIAELLIQQRHYKEAEPYIKQSLQSAAEAQNETSLLENNVLLFKMHLGTGKYKEAAMLFDTIMTLQKIVENAEERAHVERTSIALEMQRQKDALKAMAAEKDAKTTERNRYLMFSVVTLLLMGFAVAAVFQIRKKNKQLSEQKAELFAGNEMKDKMFAVISHDLRSPLNSIIGSLELFETDVLTEKERNMMINNLHLSASATLETLDNLLHWGSGQFKKESAHKEAVDVNMLAEQTLRLLSNVAAHKSVNLIQKIDDVCIARFDKSQLAFIMRNLMVNAIKFSHEGQDVELLGRKEDDRIILQVRDSGVGMSEEVRSRLFNVSERISERGTAGERGVGLGLILISEFLEKNNGKIRVTSIEGAGSCFEVDIPAV